MNLLEIHSLAKSFNWIKAIQDLSFNIKSWEIVGLIGPNGSWKSTLFNLILNIIKKDEWKIIFDWIDISDKKTHEISSLWISRTFQDALPLPQIKVHENLDIAFFYPMWISLSNVFFKWKFLKEEEKAHLSQIRQMLSEVWLEDKMHSLAKDLSYWQWKLLEILKVFASDKKLILLDEPFSGLFPEMINLIKDLIFKLSKKWKTIILIEHNMDLIAEICNKVIVLDAGKKIAEWKFNEVKKQKIVIDSYLWS